MGLFDFFKKTEKTPQMKSSQKPPKPSSEVKEKEIGVVTHYFGKISVGIIKLKSSLKAGDKIHIKGAHDDFKQIVETIQLNHKDISEGKRGNEIGIRVTKRVHENDIVYKITG